MGFSWTLLLIKVIASALVFFCVWAIVDTAKKRGRNGTLWNILGFIFSFFIVGYILFQMPNNTEEDRIKAEIRTEIHDIIQNGGKQDNTSVESVKQDNANEKEYFGEEAMEIFADNYNRLDGHDSYSRIESDILHMLLIDVSSKTCYYVTSTIDDLYYRTVKKESAHLTIIKNCNVEKRFGVVRGGKWNKM